jgi:hypothetical protein
MAMRRSVDAVRTAIPLDEAVEKHEELAAGFKPGVEPFVQWSTRVVCPALLKR